MMKSVLRNILAGAAIIAVAAPAVATHSWSWYHWARTANPLNLKIRAAITSQWGTLNSGTFATAVGDWNTPVGTTAPDVLNLSTESASVDRRRCNPIAGKVLVCNYTYGFRGWLGIASIWLSNGHISQGTVKLNDSYHNSSPYNTGPWRALVMCQEIGHTLGLAHQDENFDNANLGTCMDYTSNPATNQHPNAHDYDQLASIYAHLTDTTNSSSSQVTNFGIRDFTKPAPQVPPQDAGGGDGPEEWGVAIHQDGRGRPDVFEKQLGGGRKLVTHVFWALETGAPR